MGGMPLAHAASHNRNARVVLVDATLQSCLRAPHHCTLRRDRSLYTNKTSKVSRPRDRIQLLLLSIMRASACVIFPPVVQLRRNQL